MRAQKAAASSSTERYDARGLRHEADELHQQEGPDRRADPDGSTVKTYVSRMLTKLNRRDRLQLAVLAFPTGLVRP
jgi:hypothetical protein